REIGSRAGKLRQEVFAAPTNPQRVRFQPASRLANRPQSLPLRCRKKFAALCPKGPDCRTDAHNRLSKPRLVEHTDASQKETSNCQGNNYAGTKNQGLQKDFSARNR